MNDENKKPKKVRRYCIGCLCDVTESMFCYCGEFPLSEKGTYTDEDLKRLNIKLEEK